MQAHRTGRLNEAYFLKKAGGPFSVSFAATVAECLNQQCEGRGRLSAARVVEVVARKRWAPVSNYPYELATGEVWARLILRQVRQAEPGQGCSHAKGDVVEYQLAFDAHF